MSVPVIQAAEVALGRQRAPQYESGKHIVQYLRSANIGDGFLDLSDVKSMNFAPSEQTKFHLRAGDVLVTEGSGSRDAVGTSGVWLDELPTPVCFQNTVLRLRPRPGISDGRYLAWWMRHAHASGLIAAVATGANILHLGAENLRGLPIDLPSLMQQQRIADFLDKQVSRIDQAIDARRRQEVVLQEQIGALAHSEVTGAARHDRKPSGLAWSRDLPSHWGSTRLGNVARLGTGHTPSRSEPDYWVDCDFPWVTTSDVKRFRFDQIDSIEDTELYINQRGLDNSSAVIHPAGTVALSRTASAGFSIVMSVDMSTSQDYATWTPGPRVDSYYLLWCLRAMRRDVMQRLAMGSTHKTIYFPDLAGIRIPLPPIVEQRAIVERISSRVSVIRSAQGLVSRSVELLEERKRALITAAVTGEFDVSTASGRGVA